MTVSLSQSTTPTQGSTFRVLLADDSVESHLLLQCYLRDTPYQVEAVSDGAQAVAAFTARPFDLVLIDQHMPVMDGFTATRRIRDWEASQQRAPVPILALTAHSFNDAQEQSRSAGCTGLLSKPLTKQQLFDTLRTYSAAETSPDMAREAPSRADITARIEEAIQRQRPIFLDHRRQDVKTMRDAVEQGDYESLQTMGHRIKGLAGSYGFPEIGLAGAHLEQAAQARDLALVQQAITELSLILARTEQAA
ncbi:MAG: response regulator [Nitrospira sp.]|jgi:CheY-like chemotaxis protein|nr:response regulator [Nitrospira sp.]MDR4471944.1 response regulator [Nitrospira sp.]MDR4476418.1 response regulator [Nitrospira sp.]HAP40320.1 hypothetical protein [Nitrospira sp.]